MSFLKRLLLSIVCGTALTAFPYFLYEWIGDNFVISILLYPLKIWMYFFAPEPLFIGYDQQGNPMYEGGIGELFTVIVGIIMCVPFYSTICFVALTLANRIKRKTLK